MKTLQVQLKGNAQDESQLAKLKDWQPHLVFAFGNTSYFKDDGQAAKLQKHLNASIVGCSSSGEISNDGTHDKTLILTGVQFKKGRFKLEMVSSKQLADSEDNGEALAKKLSAPDLKAVMVFGKGVQVNGTALIAGLKKALGQDVLVTGGLAGDDGAFVRTYVLMNATSESDAIVGLGLYGEEMEVHFGYGGGWEPFGPVRRITKASGTTLFEIDGEKALNVYKSYLNDFVKDLPGSGLMFPFALLDTDHAESGLIRTILGIDEATGSLQLAGEIGQGNFVRLMHTNSKGLIGGATTAGNSIDIDKTKAGLAIAVSCVGRKLVLGEDVDEEIEALQDILPEHTLTGFYSNGEIGPFRSRQDSQLHNQTITVTCINEKD